MKVIICEPLKEAYVKDIPAKLKEYQTIVKGIIQVIYPFEEEVGLICNEEGKLDGLPFNRSLKDEENNIYDIIAGNFIVVGLSEDSFKSLSPEQCDKYLKLFQYPEFFV